MLMRIDDQIDIASNSLMESLRIFFPQLERILDSNDDTVTFSLNHVIFARPLYLALLLLLRDNFPKKIRFSGYSSYLNTICFPETISIDLLENKIANWRKTYLPVISARRNACNQKQTSDAVSAAINLLRKNTSIKNNVLHGLQYMLQETVDNFWEHSDAEKLYILCQHYPASGFTDIVVADNGITLAGSYAKAGMSVADDLEAIECMASAISSKNRPENESRGYGLSTSRQMSTVGLGGEFLCLSGNAFFFKKGNRKPVFVYNKNLRTAGTVIALRCDSRSEAFNLYNFLES